MAYKCKIGLAPLVNPTHCSTFRLITANFSSVQKLRTFTEKVHLQPISLLLVVKLLAGNLGSLARRWSLV